MDEEFEKKLMEELNIIISECNEGNIKLVDHLEKLRIEGGELDIATIYSMQSKNTSKLMMSYSDHVKKILEYIRDAKIRFNNSSKKSKWGF